MGRLRGSLLVTILFGIVIVVFTSRTFLKYQPPIPETSRSVDENQDRVTRVVSRNSQTTASNSESSLTESRVRRLQEVVRNQRAELARLRAATRSITPTARKTRKASSLLSKLPDLSLLTGNSDAEDKPTYEQLSTRLVDLREFAVELDAELTAAELVVEMQSAEIEELQTEVEETRERIATVADASEDLDSVVGRLLQESRDLEGVARQTLIRLGPPAAAMLLALEDQPAHVRAWITDVLTEIEIDQSGSDRP
jgi:chromosome segregation ATPase